MDKFTHKTGFLVGQIMQGVLCRARDILIVIACLKYLGVFGG